ALELSWVSVGDEPVAVSYSIIWNNRVQFYQGGRTTDVPKGVRPGIVLHAHAIRAAIDAKREEYDFLSGTSQYKMQLSTATRPLIQLRASRPGYHESIRKLTDRGVDLLRRARRRWREMEAKRSGAAGAGPAGAPADGASAGQGRPGEVHPGQPG